MAVKSDVKTGHDIAYVTCGHASGCAGAMAYYTRTGDPPGTWEGRGTAALGISGKVRRAPPQPTAEHHVTPEADRNSEPDLDTAWSAEIRDEPSYEPEPEPDMPEATAEI